MCKIRKKNATVHNTVPILICYHEMYVSNYRKRNVCQYPQKTKRLSVTTENEISVSNHRK